MAKTARRNYRILLIGLLLAALVGLAWRPLCLGEPWYRWRPLSAWLNDYGAGPRAYKPCPEADEAIRQMGRKVVPHLLRLLNETDPGPSAIAVPAVHSQVNRSNSNFKSALIHFVENHTSIRFHRVPTPASWDHWKAYLGFQALGSKGKIAIPYLSQLAHDPRGSSQFPSGITNISLIAKLANNSRSYITIGDGPFMEPGGHLFRATNEFLLDGEIAALSLAAIGKESVPSLIGLLGDPSPRIRQRGAGALGLTGADAGPAVPDLVQSLKDPDRDVRFYSAQALGWIKVRPELAVPALTSALKDSELSVKLYAAESVGEFREQATAAIPDLLEYFQSTDYRLREVAALALNKISPETTLREILPVLLAQRQDSNPAFRNGAIVVLSQFHTFPTILIPVFVQALDDSDLNVRMNAVHALGGFGADAKAAVPRIISLTPDQNPFIREQAIEALKRIQ